jgi:hypothetical protein
MSKQISSTHFASEQLYVMLRNEALSAKQEPLSAAVGVVLIEPVFQRHSANTPSGHGQLIPSVHLHTNAGIRCLNDPNSVESKADF